MKQPSVMSHNFSQVPAAEIQRSSFDRSSGLKTTMDAGLLVPVFIDEALPGDTFSLNTTIFGRLATPIVPVMDNLYLDTFFFAVPLRLVWDNFQKMMGEQRNPGDSTDFLIPQMTVPAGGYDTGSLSDYFGIPVGVDGFSHSALFHRAYNLIWNEWFRDQNLQNSKPVNADSDGPDDPNDYDVQRRGKRHDYFTSCLPWPQKGPAVTLPLGTSAPVQFDPASDSTTLKPSWFQPDGSSEWEPVPTDASAAALFFTDAGSGQTVMTKGAFASGRILAYDPNGTMYADLSTATAATINALREAFQLQRLFERDARGGTRFVELIKSHFGVTIPDARLQRPEYLGGGSRPINFTPVPQTSATDATTPQANLSAFATGVSQSGFTKSFVEHSIIIGLASIRADLNYQQGLDRMMSRRTKYDFYWPALAHLGEQAVLNKELITLGTSADDNVWGYQERWAEYRYRNSKVTGKMRSSVDGSLDIWHLAYEFDTGAPPALNAAFIEERPPIRRIMAVVDEPQFIVDAYHKLKTARPMPMYSVPGLIDHF